MPKLATVSQSGVLPLHLRLNPLPFERVKKYPDHILYGCRQGYLIGSPYMNEIQHFGGVQRLYFKTLVCGREWCEFCGMRYSLSHNRRIVKATGRLNQFGQSVGYLVVTVPDHLREFFKSAETLRDFKDYWKRKLKRTEKYVKRIVTVPGKQYKTSCRVSFKEEVCIRKGYKKGYIRYHYAGEDGTTYKPHLNILLPSGFLDPAILEKWRQDLAEWFCMYTGTDEVVKPNLQYAYTTSKYKIKHWLNYVTRATWRNPEDKKAAGDMLFNFRNGTFFGKYEKNQGAPEVAKLLHSVCPVTGKKIIWGLYTKNFFEAIQVDNNCPEENIKSHGLGIYEVVGYLNTSKVKKLKKDPPIDQGAPVVGNVFRLARGAPD